MNTHLRSFIASHTQLQKFMKSAYVATRSTLLKVSPVLGCYFIYRITTGTRLNLKSPDTFNDKIQWLKLYRYNKDPLVIQCADKIAVRDYVSDKGLGSLLNELYGVYDQADAIVWDTLPDSFVLKTTHGSGGNVICESKTQLNITPAKQKLSASLKIDYGKASAEFYYSRIKPRIIAELYLKDGSRKMPRDYKVYCFNGKPKLILAIADRDTSIKLDFLSLDWQRLKIGQESFESATLPEQPKLLKEMLLYAETLAEPFPFVRTDFYEIDGRIIFGEMTFTPAAGVSTYYNEYGQEYLGGLLDLSNNIEKG